MKTFRNPYSAADKLAQLESNTTTRAPDIIITDYTFSPTPTRKGVYADDVKDWAPEGGGLKIIEQLRECSPPLRDIPVILHTGADNVEYLNFRGANVTVLSKGKGQPELFNLVAARLSCLPEQHGR